MFQQGPMPFYRPISNLTITSTTYYIASLLVLAVQLQLCGISIYLVMFRNVWIVVGLPS